MIGAPADRRPPFVVDYTVDGRQFSILLEGPADWAEAEAHLAGIRASAALVGSDAVEVPADRALCLWLAIADTLLNACTAAGRPHDMALAGAAVMVASDVIAGFDRAQAITTATAAIDAAYREGTDR